MGDRPARRLARQTLAEVVEPRYEELFGLAREELRRSGFEEIIAAGIVLTGGSAKMEGAIELAEEVFHVPVRLGQPQHIRGLSDVVRNPDLLDRRRPAAVRARQRAGRQPRPVDHRQCAFHGGTHEELVSGELLTWVCRVEVDLQIEADRHFD